METAPDIFAFLAAQMAGLALLLVALVILILSSNRHYSKSDEQQRQQGQQLAELARQQDNLDGRQAAILDQLSELTKTSQQQTRQLAQLQQDITGLAGRVQAESVSGRAIDLAREGMSAEKLAEATGLSLAEAEMITASHGPGGTAS